MIHGALDGRGDPHRGYRAVAIHHSAGGGGDPHRGYRTVYDSPRNPRLAPRARAALLRPGRRWHELTALRVLAHHAVCEAPQLVFNSAIVGTDVS